MKYAFKTIKDGYQQIDYQSGVVFENDVIYFANIIDMYRHLYYAKYNQFEISVNKYLFTKRNLLKTIIIHHGRVKLNLENKDIFNIFYLIYLKLFCLMVKVKFPSRDFEPYLKQGKINQCDIYILDGYVINQNNFEYKSTLVNADSDLSHFPFKFKIDQEPVVIDVAEHDYQFNAKLENEGYSVFENRIAKCRHTPQVYIYNMDRDQDGITLSVFLQGYQTYEDQFTIDTENKYTVLPSEDWKYYSKLSNHFKSNFIKIKFETIDNPVQFMYKDRLAIILLTRNLGNKTIYNDLVLEHHKFSFRIDSNIDDYKDEYYQKIELLKANNNPKIYIFSDRQDKADDNAEVLYRYYKNNTDKQIYFALSRDCQCWNRLKEEGFNLIEFGSSLHKEKYLLADKIISSHAARRIYDPFYPQKDYYNLETFKFTFLQHGIVMGEHHGFLDKLNNPLDLIISSTDEEQSIIRNFSGYDNIVVSGLARYDNYTQNQTDTDQFIIYAPSWNVKYRDDLKNSKYIQEIENVLNSHRINQILKAVKIDIHFILHPEFINEQIELKNTFEYKLMAQDEFLYSQQLRDCRGLITDYSSLFFDVLYQEKFVVHHQPYELHHSNDQLVGYQGGLYKCYDIDKLEEIIATLASNNFEIDDDRRAIIQSFFKYNDKNFCKRNYQAIENL